MREVILRELLLLLLWCLGGIVMGALISHIYLGLILALLGFLLSRIVTAWRLLVWVEQGQVGKPPSSWGIWKMLGDSLYRSRQGQMKVTRNIRRVFVRISQLTNAINEGMVLLDAEFHLQWWNNSAEKLLGLRSSDRNLALTTMIRNPRFINYLEQEEYRHVLELPDKQDGGRWLSYAAYRFGEGEIVLIITDITRLKKAELMRKDFVGNVSHELRTPLTVMRGYLETLVDSGLVDNPRALRAFGQMREQVLRMQAMADDLITLSKLDVSPDADSREVEDVRLLPLLEKLVEEARVISGDQHRFSIQCDPSASYRAVLLDMHSALGNLINNGVRHNPPGTLISITVKVDNVKGNLDIHITDDGVGIQQEIIPRLTERFYRADSSRTSSKGGTGLGLAIVKHLVNRYGGKLVITSQVGKGSDFLCRFPMKKT